jgi:hypothetical protein
VRGEELKDSEEHVVIDVLIHSGYWVIEVVQGADLFCFGCCLQPEAILRCSSVLDCAVNFSAPLSCFVVQELSEYFAVVEQQGRKPSTSAALSFLVPSLISQDL